MRVLVVGAGGVGTAVARTVARRNLFERVIMAVGITGNIENLGLENTKVKTEKGHIKINQWFNILSSDLGNL